MKKLFLSYLFVLLASLCFASPFGLKMGMTIEEIAEVCETEPIGSDGAYLITPLKSHPSFKWYMVEIHETKGLYAIYAISSTIPTTGYGKELKNTFNDIQEKISKTYGKPQITDRNVDDTFRSEDYWLYTLERGSRELSASWGKDKKLADNIDYIALKCVSSKSIRDSVGYLAYSTIFGNSSSSEGGHLVLRYEFTNATSIEDEQDSVF